ncbi:MAG TPA: CocE/NonD family hydrolase, partial [Solirubrobacteraceae bacterium]|nr:CocE/NonD family hydrolase [Solirubrobacteraceae bacterium]
MRRTSAAVLALAIVFIIPAAAEAKVKAHGSVEQVYVTGAKRGAKLTLKRNGHRVARQRAGRHGAAVFRNVRPGRYRLAGKRIRVLPNRSKPPTKKLYRQRIPKDGYGYLTTRDGTKLAINVHLPSGTGPYPTLIEYSGYGYANPAGAESSISPVLNLLGYAVVDVNMRGTGCSGGAFDYFEPLQGLDGYDVVETVAPGGSSLPDVGAGPYPTLIEYAGYGYADPAGPQNGISVLANLMGFTVVDVNMRGTGCSGGAFDFFEPNQNLDGYDIVETVARQPWVLHNRVGMAGVSFGGISQLFVAATRPPHLAAIAPLSVIDATATTLYPGGVLNTGFALSWAKD